MACRTGCYTQDHDNWGDCLRASNIQMSTGDANGAVIESGWNKKKWNNELNLYKQARAQGIQPDGTSIAKVQRAIDISNKTGIAYGSNL